MGVIHKARNIQRMEGTQQAVQYLKRRGYQLEQALYILAGRK